MLDVAHNPDGVAELARALAAEPVTGRSWAIVGMMADKDIHAALAPLLPLVAGWIAVDLAVPRAASSGRIAAILRELGAAAVSEAEAMGEALALAREWASKDDRIVVFGSFYTVAEVLSQPL